MDFVRFLDFQRHCVLAYAFGLQYEIFEQRHNGREGGIYKYVICLNRVT